MSDTFKYPGDELVLFQHAHNWKKYFSGIISPYIQGEVLENGAGIGSTTLLLNDGKTTRWVLAEPDAEGCALQPKSAKNYLPCTVHHGTMYGPGLFHHNLYRLLEHIWADAEEGKKQLQNSPRGHLLILSPALASVHPLIKDGHSAVQQRNVQAMAVPGLERSFTLYDSTGSLRL